MTIFCAPCAAWCWNPLHMLFSLVRSVVWQHSYAWLWLQTVMPSFWGDHFNSFLVEQGAKRQAILDGCVVGFCVVDLVALWVGVRAFSNPTMYNGHTSVALERVQKILYNRITIRYVMYNEIVILSYLFFTPSVFQQKCVFIVQLGV